MAAKAIDYQQINEIIKRVESGDPEALIEANQLSSQLAKRANVRLRDLERQDLTSSKAYQRAEFNLQEDQNRTRFSESKKLDAKEVTEQLDNLSDFLTDESSSVEWQKNYQAGIEKQIDDNPEFADLNAFQKRQMRKFYESDAWAEMKKVIGTGVIAQASQKIAGGAKVKDLEEAFEKYKSSDDVDIFDVWDGWT